MHGTDDGNQVSTHLVRLRAPSDDEEYKGEAQSACPARVLAGSNAERIERGVLGQELV
jgi:hypothetical protein